MLSEIARNIKPSSTLAITARAKSLKSEGKDVIGFGAGEPDFDTPEFIKKAAIDALNAGETKYTPASGTKELKQAVCTKLARENALEFTQDEIIICCGAKHALFNVIMCTIGKDDEVIIPSPYWVSYPEMVTAAQGRSVIADCLHKSNFKLTPDTLKSYLTNKTRLIILNSPSNPTGTVYTAEELRALSEVILQSNAIVISDEIYEHLVFDGEFSSIAAVSEEMKNRTIIINGLSKAYSMTGWRIGYAAGDKEIIAACSRLQSHSTSNPTTFAQSGAVEALTSEQGPGEMKKMKEAFIERRDYVFNRLRSMNGVSVEKPRGAFYIFPDISHYLKGEIRDSNQFAMKLLDEKLVALVPGEGFGSPGFIRISYALSMDEIKKGLDRLEQFLKEIN